MRSGGKSDHVPLSSEFPSGFPSQNKSESFRRLTSSPGNASAPCLPADPSDFTRRPHCCSVAPTGIGVCAWAGPPLPRALQVFPGWTLSIPLCLRPPAAPQRAQRATLPHSTPRGRCLPSPADTCARREDKDVMLSLLPAPDLSQPCFVVGPSQFCLNEGKQEAEDGGCGEGRREGGCP